MTTPIKIDFVSDISCPWCVIGLKSLEQALARIGAGAEVSLHFQPFELNPALPPEGQEMVAHLSAKYGIDAAQIAQNSEVIRARGAALGFTFGPRARIYNTFDAHRLLYWAELEGRQQALKEALFEAYFSQGDNPGAHHVLLRVAAQVGLDGAVAAQILASDRYTDEVRARQQFYQQQGISSVPAIIINERHLISGGQSPAVFEQALRQILSQG